MGFDAGRSTTALDWDFSTLKLADEETEAILKDAKGTIPEPSQDALERFTTRLRAMATDPEMAAIVKLGPEPSPEAIVEALGTIDTEKLGDVQETMLDAVIELCAGSPSEAEVKALPPRVRNAFVGWLTGELVGPTRPTPVSRPSLAVANGAGPGT